MKKIIRVLGVTLSLVVLASCTNEGEDPAKNQDTTLETTTLTNKYKYQAALVPQGVDLDKDGIFNQNLMNENVNQCVWDNIVEFKGERFTLTDKGSVCDPTASDIIVDAKYILDKENGIIKLYDNTGAEIERFNNVRFYFNDDEKTLKFDIYDTTLKQNVSYSLTIQK